MLLLLLLQVAGAGQLLDGGGVASEACEGGRERGREGRNRRLEDLKEEEEEERRKKKEAHDAYTNRKRKRGMFTYPRSVVVACCVVARVRRDPFARWRPGAMAFEKKGGRREGGKEEL